MKQLSAFPLFLLILGIFGGTQLCVAQSLFQTVTPDVLVLGKKHPSGADIVEVSVTSATFPPELLQQRLTAMCTDLGYGPHGLQVYNAQINGSGTPMNFLKAKFGTNGLIDNASGALRLQPIARAFAGIPAPNTVKGISVTFDSLKPDSRTLRTFKNSAVELEAQYNQPPAAGLEYRVSLLKQEPNAITIPDHAEPTPAKTTSDTKADASAASPPWVTGLLLGVTAIAFGALVYFGFLRFNAKRR